ncbi:hypothetical protein [Elizabethkingia meningoseptica]|uniref:hypothetical protein n=1 Tax=Elizabethkingia meningoseptica TaxID=238 RepID=UPI00162484E5|nr:hypothetical protein [Elizabethkingia meningoseptica]MBG0514081.1 hypothetical protein [Elizabethkingia meningoseptica]MDE5432997.1 hypothetical protein [Elizabethkingia meningoseptica]
MSNKTALQELIEKANRFKEVSSTGKLDIDEVLKELNNSLEKEKKQIMEAYNSGYSEGYLDSDNKGMGFCSPSDYYNEKYVNNGTTN